MAGISAKGSKLYLKAGADFVAGDVIANLTSIGEAGGDIDELETTDLDSGVYKEFTPSMKDSGSISIAGNLVLGGTGYTRLKALFDLDPTDANVFGRFGIAHPIIVEANMQFDAYVSSLKVGERTPDGLLTFTAELRVSGAQVDFTPPGGVTPPVDPGDVDLAAELATYGFDYEDTLTNPFNMAMSFNGYTAGDASASLIVTSDFGANEFSASYPSSPSAPSVPIVEANVVSGSTIIDEAFVGEVANGLAEIIALQAYFVANATTTTVSGISGSVSNAALLAGTQSTFTITYGDASQATVNCQLQGGVTLYFDAFTDV